MRARTPRTHGRQSRAVVDASNAEDGGAAPDSDAPIEGGVDAPTDRSAPLDATSRSSSTASPSPRHDVEDERLLVERAQAGDAAAFGALYRLHVSAVYRYAVAPLVRDRALAEELVADTFVRAHENLGRFVWQGRSILPWLVRIGRNLALDALRRSRRLVPLAEGKAARLPAREAHGDVEGALARGELREQARDRVQQALDELSERYRLVITLRLLEQRSREESAQVLAVTVGTLDVLLCRACKSFRKIYEARFGAHALENLELG